MLNFINIIEIVNVGSAIWDGSSRFSYTNLKMRFWWGKTIATQLLDICLKLSHFPTGTQQVNDCFWFCLAKRTKFQIDHIYFEESFV